MPLTQNILVATDFSDSALAGLKAAATLAVDNGANLTLCHVLDPSPLAPLATRGRLAVQLQDEQDLESAIHANLTRLIEEYCPDHEGAKTALILSSSAAEGICHYADKDNSDLIVISTHGRTGLSQLLIGSVAEKVVRHASVPVLTIRSDASAD